MIDFLEFPKTKKFDLIVEGVVFNSAVILKNADFVEEKISNVAKLSDMPKTDALKQLEIGRQEISRIKLNELLAVRDFLNEQYPPPITNFIKDLDWKKSSNYRDTLTCEVGAFLFNIFDYTNDEGKRGFECEMKVRVGACMRKDNEGRFETLEQAKTWANEQHKDKLKEVLGL